MHVKLLMTRDRSKFSRAVLQIGLRVLFAIQNVGLRTGVYMY